MHSNGLKCTLYINIENNYYNWLGVYIKGPPWEPPAVMSITMLAQGESTEKSETKGVRSSSNEQLQNDPNMTRVVTAAVISLWHAGQQAVLPLQLISQVELLCLPPLQHSNYLTYIFPVEKSGNNPGIKRCILSIKRLDSLMLAGGVVQPVSVDYVTASCRPIKHPSMWAYITVQNRDW